MGAAHADRCARRIGDAYVAAATGDRDDNGHTLVARNGKARPRTIDTGEKIRFKNEILPPWARKSPRVAHVLPLLYLHALSTGDFVPALEQFFGSDAGLSASAITRLTTGAMAPAISHRFTVARLRARSHIDSLGIGIMGAN